MTLFELNPKEDVMPDFTEMKKPHSGGAFSFFRKPVRNITPSQVWLPMQAYQAITGTRYEEVTRVLRSIADKDLARGYKANFLIIVVSQELSPPGVIKI